MANCRICGKRLPLFYRDTVCRECRAKLQLELADITRYALTNKDITNEQIGKLKNQDRTDIIKLYNSLFQHFSSDKEVDAQEITTLQKLQNGLFLSDAEVKFDEQLKPYIYIQAIRNKTLPEVELKNAQGIVFKKDEKVHFVDGAILKETKSVSIGYSGGSQGVSIRIASGVYYRVGGTRGHIMREDRLTETSRGIFVITNQRAMLNPTSIGSKSLDIPLSKIFSYSCYENGVEIYKEGHEKGYFLEFLNKSSAEIVGMLLGFLTSRQS
ncbi:MAG: hypothetical protein ACP5QX_06830 [Caldisericaceae bacterium]